MYSPIFSIDIEDLESSVPTMTQQSAYLAAHLEGPAQRYGLQQVWDITT